MDLKEKLDNLNEGCEKCHVNLCNHCPVGNVKKEIRKKLGIQKESTFEVIKSKLFNIFTHKNTPTKTK